MSRVANEKHKRHVNDDITRPVVTLTRLMKRVIENSRNQSKYKTWQADPTFKLSRML